MDLKEMVQGIQVEASAGIMEVAFKTKGGPRAVPRVRRWRLRRRRRLSPRPPRAQAAAEEPRLPPRRGCRRGARAAAEEPVAEVEDDASASADPETFGLGRAHELLALG